MSFSCCEHQSEWQQIQNQLELLLNLRLKLAPKLVSSTILFLNLAWRMWRSVIGCLMVKCILGVVVDCFPSVFMTTGLWLLQHFIKNQKIHLLFREHHKLSVINSTWGTGSHCRKQDVWNNLAAPQPSGSFKDGNSKQISSDPWFSGPIFQWYKLLVFKFNMKY